MKTCPDCQVLLPTTSFAKGSPRSKDGLYTYCRGCSAKRKKAYRLVHPEIDKAYRDKCLEDSRRAREAKVRDELAELLASGMRCRRCNVSKPVEEFRGQARNKFGLSHWCKSCEAASQRVWYEKNADRLREISLKKYYEQRTLNLERMKAWYRKNLQARRKCARDYHQTPAGKANKVAHRQLLKSPYVRELIVKHHPTLRSEEIPQQIIQIKRDEVALRRLARLLTEGAMKYEDAEHCD